MWISSTRSECQKSPAMACDQLLGLPIPTDNIVPDVDDYSNVGRDLNDDGDDYGTSFICQYWKCPKMRGSQIFFSTDFKLGTLQCESLTNN